MALLTKDQILNTDDLKRETVPVPEWGDGAEVIVQEMTAIDRDRLRLELYGEDGKTEGLNFAGHVLVKCLVDEEGRRLFADSEAETLGKKSLAALQRLFSVAQRLNQVAVTEEAIKN